MDTIELGALAPPLSAQLARLGVASKSAAALERMADAISILSVHGLILSAEAERARRRLVRKIQNEARHAASLKRPRQ